MSIVGVKILHFKLFIHIEKKINVNKRHCKY